MRLDTRIVRTLAAASTLGLVACGYGSEQRIAVDEQGAETFAENDAVLLHQDDDYKVLRTGTGSGGHGDGEREEPLVVVLEDEQVGGEGRQREPVGAQTPMQHRHEAIGQRPEDRERRGRDGQGLLAGGDELDATEQPVQTGTAELRDVRGQGAGELTIAGGEAGLQIVQVEVPPGRYQVHLVAVGDCAAALQAARQPTGELVVSETADPAFVASAPDQRVTAVAGQTVVLVDPAQDRSWCGVVQERTVRAR